MFRREVGVWKGTWSLTGGSEGVRGSEGGQGSQRGVGGLRGGWDLGEALGDQGGELGSESSLSKKSTSCMQ